MTQVQGLVRLLLLLYAVNGSPCTAKSDGFKREPIKIYIDNSREYEHKSHFYLVVSAKGIVSLEDAKTTKSEVAAHLNKLISQINRVGEVEVTDPETGADKRYKKTARRFPVAVVQSFEDDGEIDSYKKVGETPEGGTRFKLECIEHKVEKRPSSILVLGADGVVAVKKQGDLDATRLRALVAEINHTSAFPLDIEDFQDGEYRHMTKTVKRGDELFKHAVVNFLKEKGLKAHL